MADRPAAGLAPDSDEGPNARSLAEARRLAAACHRCPLYQNATQTVFGEGPARAELILVGEQPGDREDIAGRPVVGPAGQILDKALLDAGISRETAYLTNAVKHFKNEPRGKRRLHHRPNAGEIDRCKWWLDLELKLVKPRMVAALGASAASSLLGRRVTIGRERGHVMPFQEGTELFITVHPSYILRQRSSEAREREYEKLVADFRRCASAATGKK